MEKAEYEDEKPFHTFTKEEVYAFSKETGDENKIHLTDHPVVQGMLLLRTAACAHEDLKRLDVKFVAFIRRGRAHVGQQWKRICALRRWICESLIQGRKVIRV